jgi:hypothetical protein
LLGHFLSLSKSIGNTSAFCFFTVAKFEYMIRPLLSLKRLFFDETAGRIRYQHSRHGSQEESMDYLEFIARVTSHIPDKGQVMIRYYCLYSNTHRGKIRKAGADPSYPLITEDGPTYVPANGWAEVAINENEDGSEGWI